jgi:hypothetical protein
MLKQLLVSTFLLTGLVKVASADLVPEPPARPALVDIVGGGMYKYGAAIVEDYGWKLMWWCKGDSTPPQLNNPLYRQDRM